MARPNGTVTTTAQTKLGTLIRQKRISLGLTQTDLAHLLGVSQSLVSGYESGTIQLRKEFGPIYAERFAKALECDVDEILQTLSVSPTELEELGKLVAAKRRAQNLTKQRLAKLAGMSVASIVSYEGKSGTISYIAAQKLARVLNIPIEDFAPFIYSNVKAQKLSPLGKRIRGLRKNMGISASRMARILGVTPSWVTQIETIYAPNNLMCERIAKYFGIPVQELLDLRDQK